MRYVVLLLAFFTSAGCVSHALVGRFRAKSGELLEISRDGRITYRTTRSAQLVGRLDQQDGLLELITRMDAQPRIVIADYPSSNCVCVGMRLTYSDDRSAVYVDWPPGFNTTRDWPMVFLKE